VKSGLPGSTTVHVGLEPVNIEVDQVTHTVYVTTRVSAGLAIGDTVSVIDAAPARRTVVGLRKVAHITPARGGLDRLHDSTHTAYTAIQSAGTVSVINMASCDATETRAAPEDHTVTVGAQPWTLTSTEAAPLYVANNYDDTVSVITLHLQCHDHVELRQLQPTVRSAWDRGPPGGMMHRNRVLRHFLATRVGVSGRSCSANTTRGCVRFLRLRRSVRSRRAAVDTAKTQCHLTRQEPCFVLTPRRNANDRRLYSRPRPCMSGRVGGVGIDQATGTCTLQQRRETVSVIDAATVTHGRRAARNPSDVTVGESFGVAVDQCDRRSMSELGRRRGDTVSGHTAVSCMRASHGLRADQRR